MDKITLIFNDGVSTQISYSDAKKIPLLQTYLEVNPEDFQTISFNSLSSPQWKGISSFFQNLDFLHRFDVKTLSSKDNDEQLNVFYTVFNKIYERPVTDILNLISIADFFLLQRLYDMALASLLIKATEKFEEFIKEYELGNINLTKASQKILIDKIKKIEIGNSFLKSCTVKNSKDFDECLVFNFDDDGNVLNIKKKYIAIPSFYLHNSIIVKHPPKINIFKSFNKNFFPYVLSMYRPCTKNKGLQELASDIYYFSQFLLIRHIKKEWQKLNLEKTGVASDENYYKCLQKIGNTSHFRLISPEYKVQICKHTYPEGFSTYQSFNEIPQALKEMTTADQCSQCNSIKYRIGMWIKNIAS